MMRNLFLALTSSAVSPPDSPVCYSANLFSLILSLSCLLWQLVTLPQVQVKCYQFKRVIYIPEQNFILIPVSGVDIVGPEQFPGPAAFLTSLFVSAVCGVVQATILFFLLWISFHG